VNSRSEVAGSKSGSLANTRTTASALGLLGQLRGQWGQLVPVADPGEQIVAEVTAQPGQEALGEGWLRPSRSAARLTLRSAAARPATRQVHVQVGELALVQRPGHQFRLYPASTTLSSLIVPSPAHEGNHLQSEEFLPCKHTITKPPRAGLWTGPARQAIAGGCGLLNWGRWVPMTRAAAELPDRRQARGGAGWSAAASRFRWPSRSI
jgi:hypothetical protein